ncbi:MAG: hypothetical protein IT168_31530 [Bryobacterales bacterium]|nr:hypothetical protein [Bryobacterales bacterium]
MRRVLSLMLVATAVFGAEAIPKFEDFPVSQQWSGPKAPVRLVRPDERLFRTRLKAAAQEEPNFAGHYRFANWGCGSVCVAGAIVDLKTGDVYPPPKAVEGSGWDRWIVAGGFIDGPLIDFRADSRLLIVRQPGVDSAYQEARYYEWLGTKFKLLLTRVEKKQMDGGQSGR